MVHNLNITERRTSVDLVFDHLYDEIVSMRLLPGTKISEAEMARAFDISRQPVRDAFSRLENMDLLLIRPQRATEVKRFSSKAITTARFVRAAVEAEVLRRAAGRCKQDGRDLLESCIEDQRVAVEKGDYDLFCSLDYAFHEAFCHVGEADYVFDVIAKNKAKVDRLCVLGLIQDSRMEQLFDDHLKIAQMVISNNEQGAVDAGMLHLTRLDDTIVAIQKENADYFDD